MGIEIVLTGGTENSPFKLDGKVLPGLESSFFVGQKRECPKTAQEVPEQDCKFTEFVHSHTRYCGMWDHGTRLVPGEKKTIMEGGKARRNTFFLLIHTGEDNEGKHFHFKGIVHRKSECDLSGQGSL